MSKEFILAVQTRKQQVAKTIIGQFNQPQIQHEFDGQTLQKAVEDGAILLFSEEKIAEFQADITKKLVAGLGNQKILSGADNAAVDRVIVNLTQIRASSKDANRDKQDRISECHPHVERSATKICNSRIIGTDNAQGTFKVKEC